MQVVGTAMDVEKPAAEGIQDRPELRRKDSVRLRTVFGLGFLQFGGDSLQGFVPGDALEFALSLLSHPLHGVLQAVRRIDELHAGMAFGTERSRPRYTVVESFRIGFDFHKLAVLNVAEDAAAGFSSAAAVAKGGDYLVLFYVVYCR